MLLVSTLKTAHGRLLLESITHDSMKDRGMEVGRSAEATKRGQRELVRASQAQGRGPAWATSPQARWGAGVHGMAAGARQGKGHSPQVRRGVKCWFLFGGQGRVQAWLGLGRRLGGNGTQPVGWWAGWEAGGLATAIDLN